LEYLIDLGLFLAKTVVIVLAVGWIIATIAAQMQRPREHHRGQIQVTDLSRELEQTAEMMRSEIMEEKAFKKFLKARKGKRKSKNVLTKGQQRSADAEQDKEGSRGRVYVIRFRGGDEAEEVSHLREEITAILSVAEAGDEVVVSLESPGGVVHGYGHAASQLQRLKDAGLRLTATVDEVAASGGYMMACVADDIVAAPFAIVGSIGVVAEIPNFHRLLQKNDIDVEQHTAGEYKRTLTLLGRNTEKGRRKFMEELEEAHDLFKQWVKEHREHIDIDKVATGEYWYGRQAKALGLVDRLGTTDDVLFNFVRQERKVFEIRYEPPRQPGEHLGRLLHRSLAGALDDTLSRWLKRERYLR
jgi:serine protease SohB